VSEIHAPPALAAAVAQQLESALACAPGAIADAKQLFRKIATGAVSQSETIEALAKRWESEEARQGIEAFFQHRRPPWAP
jgi:methylglutaconyl-CoA hydratase